MCDCIDFIAMTGDAQPEQPCGSTVRDEFEAHSVATTNARKRLRECVAQLEHLRRRCCKLDKELMVLCAKLGHCDATGRSGLVRYCYNDGGHFDKGFDCVLCGADVSMSTARDKGWKGRDSSN